MKISIAMTTFNGEKYILEQLKSIANQTLKPNELVVCDDISTDNTLGILNDFRSRVDFEVKIYINSNRLGHKQNFSKAANLTSGDYVFFCDQDDVWLNNKIESCINYIKKDQHSMMFLHDAFVVNDRLDNNKQCLYDWSKDTMHIKNRFDKLGFFGNCCCCKRLFLENCLPIPYVYAHDEWLGIIAYGLGLLTIIPESLILYRRHLSAVSINYNNFEDNYYNYICKRINSLLSNRNPVYEEYIKCIELINILNSISHKIGFSEDNFDSFLKANTDKLSVIKKRIDILKYPLSLKILHILKGAVLGKYKFFKSPWKRIIEDIIVN